MIEDPWHPCWLVLVAFAQGVSGTSPSAIAHSLIPMSLWLFDDDIYKKNIYALPDYHSPKQELMKPYQLHPCFPRNHLPFILAAKLSVVPHKHTSMSLTLIFNSSIFTGVRSFLNLQKSINTTKLLRKPKTIMMPRTTARTMNPVGDSICEGGISLKLSRNESSSLTLKL